MLIVLCALFSFVGNFYAPTKSSSHIIYLKTFGEYIGSLWIFVLNLCLYASVLVWVSKVTRTEGGDNRVAPKCKTTKRDSRTTKIKNDWYIRMRKCEHKVKRQANICSVSNSPCQSIFLLFYFLFSFFFFVISLSLSLSLKILPPNVWFCFFFFFGTKAIKNTKEKIQCSSKDNT